MKALALLLLWAATAFPAVTLPDQCSEEITFANCDNATLKFTGLRETIRYGYDKRLHRCIPFPHRDCGPQRNSFVNKKQCESTCGKPSEFCSKPLVQGPCLASLRRFGYDPNARKCVRFNYGGCGGNENNFATRIECRETCRDDSSYDPSDVCNLPLERGPCLGDYSSYAYDSQTRRCVKFSYGGCGGNGNRFQTEAQCMKICSKSEEDVCSLPIETGPCVAAIIRHAYNSTLQKCVPFTFGGCEGNANNFEKMQDCQSVCGGESKPADKPGIGVCKLSIEAGPCRGNHRRYGYDVKQQKCVLFNYGGCLGNENNFEALEECESLCYGVVDPNPSGPGAGVCTLPITVGPCRGTYRRYGYDSSLQKCVMFVYGGCFGNANNFMNLQDCQAACEEEETRPSTVPAQCMLPVDVGPCRGEYPRYAYDSAQRKCVLFTYGGCRGNQNRFMTLSECQAMCMEQESTTLPPVSPGVCILPITRGPCRGNYSRYGYDSVQKKCVEFVYGGCRGNQNRFERLSDCQAVCEGEVPTPAPQPSPKEVCSLPVVKGPCLAYIPSYAYNAGVKKCVRFIYGGCEGNENRFDTLEECQSACERGVSVLITTTTTTPSLPVPDICLLPIESGPCMAFLPRYAYDNSQKRCVRFIYGGCRGNENRFWDLEECLSTCMGVAPGEPTPAPTPSTDVCLLPIVKGPCLAMHYRYAYDSTLQKCVQFIYGGCLGNTNNFPTLEECQATCSAVKPTPIPTPTTPSSNVCALPIAWGSCGGYIPRYAYVSTLKKCVLFVYSGCQGNDNNFKTMEECETTCMGAEPTPTPTPSTPSPDVCALPIVRGPCGGQHRRYGYNSQLKMCRPFIYGGCLGNENNFETLEDCQSVCMEDEPTPVPTPTTASSLSSEVCSLPITKGPCLALIPSYAYDITQQKCVEFYYGGCEGNGNKFDSLAQCQSVCEGRGITSAPTPTPIPGPEVCTLPVEVGPCKAMLTRYYYDATQQKCVRFFYGGCGGNGNNFKTLTECTATCEETEPTRKPLNEICEQPIKTGPCLALLKRYAYSTRLQKCVEFTYGGCERNDNNFNTMEECVATCEQGGAPITTPTPTPGTERDICELPPDAGYCNQNLVRYAYVSSQKKCMPLVYKGCGGNKNNFVSREACEARCMKSSTNVCTQPIDVGPCKALVLRYAYDISAQKCTKFYWGGCEGNSNNFESNDECAATCEETKPNPDDAGVCIQSIDAGPCRAVLKRYAYDSTTRTCVQFVYGGCGGNTNNFETWDECASTCGLSSTPEPQNVCELDIDAGPCKANITRYAYDKTTKQCITFAYSGCRGNDNNFETMQDCIAQCAPQSEEDVCSLPLDRGTGLTGTNFGFFVIRYGYDKTSGKCVQFLYTMKGGNKNNFFTKAQCERTCVAATPNTTPSAMTTTATPGASISGDRCFLPITVGPCNSYVPRFAYNSGTRTCVLFYYGGCLGNSNRFRTLRECQYTCMYKDLTTAPTQSPLDLNLRCLLPIKVGHCMGREIRYGYSNYDCVQFEYTGCGGNSNNFGTLDECRKTCGWYLINNSNATISNNAKLRTPRRRTTRNN